MGILLGVYKELAKEAEVAETQAMLQERVEFLDKYAAVATELLTAEFPNDFTNEDVVELADRLIQRDAEIEVGQEKMAEAVVTLGEYVEASRALLENEGTPFTDATVEKLASALFELDAEEAFYKEAEVIAEASFVREFNKLAGTDFTTTAAIDEEISKLALSVGLKASTMVQRAGRDIVGLAKKNPVATGVAGAGLVGAGAVAGRLSGGDK